MYFTFLIVLSLLISLDKASPKQGLQFLYSMNVWNLKNSKARLQIMQKTEAQRRHLMNIMSAKSRIDSHSSLKPKHHISFLANSRKQISKENQNMVKRIMKINLSRNSLNSTTQLRSLGHNLRTYSSLNRSIRLKEIEDQNSKMYSRLITASPTIKREQWAKRDIQTAKYKQNLHRSKYVKPDYSQEACKMMIREPKFKTILLPVQINEAKTNINKVRRF